MAAHDRRDGLRRRGRPQRLPEDPHPIPSGLVGCDQRIAWLVTVSRVLGTDPELARREGFIATLKARGVPVDASRISRWESGLQTLPLRVVGTYEGTLGLPEGQLTSVASGLRRAFRTGPTPRDNPMREADLDDPELNRLLDLADDGHATGADWLELADHFARFDRIFLRERDWTRLCQQLVDELGTAVGTGYVRRYEAAAAFIRQASARRHLMLAVGHFVTNPDAQVVAPVLNLLSEVEDPAAGALTLRMLAADSENKYLRRAASSVAAMKLARGHFGEDALARLETHVVGALRRGESLDGRLDSFDLAVQLPEHSWERIAGALRTRRAHALVEQARRGGELVNAARAASVVADLAPAIQADTPTHQAQEPDLMLRRLLREALLHAHKPRRHHAALLIAASPYAPAAAGRLLTVASDENELLAARAWTVLMRVGTEEHHADVVRAAVNEQRPSVRSRALVTAGLSGQLDDSQGRAIVERLDTARSLERHATLFALGMAQAPELNELKNADDLETRRGATWWLEQGGAIRDADVA